MASPTGLPAARRRTAPAAATPSSTSTSRTSGRTGSSATAPPSAPRAASQVGGLRLLRPRRRLRQVPVRPAADPQPQGDRGPRVLPRGPVRLRLRRGRLVHGGHRDVDGGAGLRRASTTTAGTSRSASSAHPSAHSTCSRTPGAPSTATGPSSSTSPGASATRSCAPPGGRPQLWVAGAACTPSGRSRRPWPPGSRECSGSTPRPTPRPPSSTPKAGSTPRAASGRLPRPARGTSSPMRTGASRGSLAINHLASKNVLIKPGAGIEAPAGSSR